MSTQAQRRLTKVESIKAAIAEAKALGMTKEQYCEMSKTRKMAEARIKKKAKAFEMDVVSG